jgi:drug/metabolite transporter (DMT)-like permease
MKDIKGYAMIMGAAILWGISATAAKVLINQGVATLLIVQCRVSFSFLFLALFFLFSRPEIFRVRRNDLWKFALAGILGVGGANFTYYFAIQEATVATAILIQYTAPLAVMAYGAFTGTEFLSPVKVGVAAATLLGCFLAVGAYDPAALKATPIGIISAVGAMLTFAFLSIYTGSLLRRHSLWTTTLFSFFFAALFWLVVNPPWVVAAKNPPAEVWAALVILAIISVLIPHTLFFAGLRRVAPTRAILTSTLEPIVAIVSASIVLGESLGALQVLGAMIVLGAIVLLQVARERQADPVPAAAFPSGTDAAK